VRERTDYADGTFRGGRCKIARGAVPAGTRYFGNVSDPRDPLPNLIRADVRLRLHAKIFVHRHDFDESFTILEGEVEFTVRGQPYVAATGATVTVPSNAPHAFRNASGRAARMLCVCVPPGLDEFFMGVGVPVASRTASMPRLTPQEMQAHTRQIAPLAAKCRMEIFAPA